jgi:oxaloacetate decarboxylase alpha subunit
MFPQVGLKFLENRGKPDAFEPRPGEIDDRRRPPPPAAAAGARAAATGGRSTYRVEVNGKAYEVVVAPAGRDVEPIDAAPAAQPAPPRRGRGPVGADRSRRRWPATSSRRRRQRGQQVAAGDVIVVLEAMKMETEVRAPTAGVVRGRVKEGDAVALGDTLLTLG